MLPLLFRLDFFDDAFVALLEPGFPAAAVRALPPLRDGGISSAAAFAVGDGGDGFKDEFAFGEGFVAAAEIVPAVGEEVRHDAGDFTDLEGHGADLR